MTDKEIERIAEAVFQKILKYQNEWVEENYTDKYKISDRDAMTAEITVLSILKAEHVDKEEYESAAKVQKRIEDIKEKLKNYKG